MLWLTLFAKSEETIGNYDKNYAIIIEKIIIAVFMKNSHFVAEIHWVKIGKLLK
jgi:hypothetical protein